MFNPSIAYAARVQRAVQTKSSVVKVPAPIGGWNARDPISQMPITDAFVLDNFIPGEGGVSQRQGYASHATGMTGSYAESLMEYNGTNSSPKLFAAAPANIFDVTSSGAVGAAVVTGLTNGRWQHTMFATPGGHFLVCCNGEDDVRNYDGSSWTTPSISGVLSAALINVTSHAERLWFIQAASLKVWYLPVQSIAGTAKYIDFAPICKLGGNLVAMATWTRDGGAGMDDAVVFVTSKGEILIYSGTNPASAATWSLIGIFKGPEPVGRRCFIKYGGDLAYLSSQGILPLPQFLSQNSAGLANVAATNKISGAFRDAYASHGTKFGWQVLEYPKENLLIVNVPLAERTTQYQYVMNMRNGSWCRFKGMNAGCWGLKGDQLYWGGNAGAVYRYGAAGVYSDAGSPINALAIQAFSDFGIPNVKRFTMARPLLSGPTDYIPQVALITDYKDTLPTFSPISYEGTGPYWDETLWDEAEWATGRSALTLWQSVVGTGSVGAIALASKVTTPLAYNAVDVMFSPGGTL